MRATYNGQPGELTIEHCVILRYNENGKVRKFYQQMLVAFGPDGQPAIHWSVSNWGPGTEAPWTNTGDLKGGIKSQTEGSSYMAEQANKRQVDSKARGGYTFYTEFNAAANVPPPPKLLSELGISRLAPGLGTTVLSKGATSTPRTPPSPIVPANVRWQPLNDLRATMSELSAIAMHSLMVDDLPSAIAERQTLIDLMGEVRALHEAGEGQLEMLTLKLTAELKK
jgi:hypothetical protein